MDSVTLTVVCVLCAAPSPAAPTSLARWHPLIAEASRRFGVPEAWIAAVMHAESGGKTVFNGRPIRSAVGAMGLMQVMPKTYEDLRSRYGFGANPYDVHDNIFAGTAYLRQMYRRYGYPNLFAAYNVGPGRFDDFLWHGRALPRVTLDYVNGMIPDGIWTMSVADSKEGLSSLVDRRRIPHGQHRPKGGLFFALGTVWPDANSSTKSARLPADPDPGSGLHSPSANASLIVPLSPGSR